MPEPEREYAGIRALCNEMATNPEEADRAYRALSRPFGPWFRVAPQEHASLERWPASAALPTTDPEDSE